MKSRQIMKDIWNASLPESIDFEAMVEFYQTAAATQIKQIAKTLKDNDWDGFKQLIKKIVIPIETESNLPPPTIDDPPNYSRTAKHDKSKT